MPDVFGIHLGMSPQAALAAVKAHYPRNTLTIYDTNMSTFPVNVFQGAIVNPRDNYEDDFDFGTTLPPDKPAVWRVHRVSKRLHVARETLLATLLEKYGKESAFVGDDITVAVTDRTHIAGILWLYDEAGHHMPIPGGNVRSVLECFRYPDGVGNAFLLNEAHGDGDRAGISGWCATSLIAVYASFGGSQPIIESVDTRMVDLPLALRTAHSTAIWYHQQSELARKQDLEKAKQAKPSF